MDKQMQNLTSSQEEILLTESFYSNTCINNICGTCVCNDILDFKILEKAINFVIKNNNSFRIRIKKNINKYQQTVIDYKYEKISLVELNSKSDLKSLEKQCVNTKYDILNDKLYTFSSSLYPNV